MLKEWNINDIKVPAGRIRQDIGEEEIKSLAADIAEKGLIQAILVLADGTLVAGRRRLEATKLLNHPTITADTRDNISTSDLMAYEASENNNRKAFTVAELAETSYKIWNKVKLGGMARRDVVGKMLGISGVHAERCKNIWVKHLAGDADILEYANAHGAKSAVSHMERDVTVKSDKVTTTILNEKASLLISLFAEKLHLRPSPTLNELKPTNESLAQRLDYIFEVIKKWKIPNSPTFSPEKQRSRGRPKTLVAR